MNLQESISRGFNLLATSIVSIAGFAFAPEMFVETDMPDKIDDALLFVIGLVAIGWYMRGRNRFAQSVMPVVLVILAMLVKIGGLMIEMGDPESMGDDFGGVILFVIAAGLIVYQYQKSKKLAGSQ